jgi:hypothetical protein
VRTCADRRSIVRIDPWYEVWTDDELPRLCPRLVLSSAGGDVVTFDPVEKQIIHQIATWDDARDWLLEDEFTRATGRTRHGDP